ncbi:hypothetical protein [Klebsiella phage vB_KpnP_IME337]|uniref:Uncharacterized protein n=1 Tax=Klebsiella phage vB_KpnP_IME337 TaxID=2601650 RepID=A0A5J6CUC5_9CAUD|nr:hypothetical protein [Klebsiella phage vB_KpnP_IME337]
MRIITWAKEQYAVFLLLRAQRLQKRANDWHWAANSHAHRASLLGTEISARRYHLTRQCAKSRRRAYVLGVEATATETKAHAFIQKHKLKGFD